MTSTQQLTSTELPDPVPAPPPGVTPTGSFSVVGFLVIAALAVAVWILLRSFTARLRRLRSPEEFQSHERTKRVRRTTERKDG